MSITTSINTSNYHSAIVVMEQIAKFHLGMAQLFDSQSNKVKRIHDAQKFYKLSKHESKFYNNSILAKQAIIEKMESGAGSTQHKEEHKEAGTRALAPLHNANQKLVGMTRSDDQTKDITLLYKALRDGHEECVAVIHKCLDDVPDAKVDAVLCELINCYKK